MGKKREGESGGVSESGKKRAWETERKRESGRVGERENTQVTFEKECFIRNLLYRQNASYQTHPTSINPFLHRLYYY